jgi:hypothetical protein
MPEERHHITQIHDTHAELVDHLDNDQIGIEIYSNYMAYRDDGGVYHLLANQGEPIEFTDITADDIEITTGHGLVITDMTEGSILFVGTSGLISQDNDELFWDDTNKRLGLGHLTPLVKFDILGNIMGCDTIADDTVKNFSIGCRAYDNGTNTHAVCAIYQSNQAAANYLYIGGGDSNSYGATEIQFAVDSAVNHLGSGTKFVYMNTAGMGIGGNSFGANAANVFSIHNGTEPAAHVDDTIQIFSKDAAAGGAALGLMVEAAVTAIVRTCTHTVPIWINGTEYELMLKGPA